MKEFRDHGHQEKFGKEPSRIEVIMGGVSFAIMMIAIVYGFPLCYAVFGGK